MRKLTERHLQAFAKRFAMLKAKLDDAKAKAKKEIGAARKMAGPYGALLDEETGAPIRAATEREMNASIAAAKRDDPIGPITVHGRKCLAVPPWLLDEVPVSTGAKHTHATMKQTKAEQKILDRVDRVNAQGELCGLGTSPSNPNYNTPEHRFTRRLAEAGIIVWVNGTPMQGQGWARPGVFPG